MSIKDNASADSDRNKVTRHIGKMMATEEGKILSLLVLVSFVKSGISTIPPPVPNKPLTAPAHNPVRIIPFRSDFGIEIPPVERISTGGCFIHY
jgi:hypothetical protein